MPMKRIQSRFAELERPGSHCLRRAELTRPTVLELRPELDAVTSEVGDIRRQSGDDPSRLVRNRLRVLSAAGCAQDEDDRHADEDDRVSKIASFKVAQSWSRPKDG